MVLRKKAKVKGASYGRYITVILILAAVVILTLEKNPITSLSAESKSDNASIISTWEEFEALQQPLFNKAISSSQECPDGCGCHQTPVDCPMYYTASDVQKSAEAALSSQVRKKLKDAMHQRHEKAETSCQGSKDMTDTGGYCLRPKKGQLTLPTGQVIDMPQYSGATPRIVTELANFVNEEKVQSIAEFGAGVGHYAIDLFPKLPPKLEYNRYDGAGNVESYTKGFVQFADLAVATDLPVSEWLFSFEVGEHISNEFEGMFVRNLHRHNCKGIMLSWATLGQGGYHHVNNHSNEYMTKLFGELGYRRDAEWEARFRNPDGNKPWFIKGTMVFRRENPTC